MCVDHLRADIAVPKKLLNRSDIVAVFEQMGCERMPRVWQVAGFEKPPIWTAAYPAGRSIIVTSSGSVQGFSGPRESPFRWTLLDHPSQTRRQPLRRHYGLRTTRPSFITNVTFFNVWMFISGSSGVAIKSAAIPGLIAPRTSSTPSRRVALVVIA